MTAAAPCTSCQGRTTIVDPAGQEEEPYTCPDCGGSGKARDQIETAPTPEEVIADAIVAAFDGPDDVAIVVSAHAIAEVAWKAARTQQQ